MLGWRLGLAASTVHAVLRRHGCSRLGSGLSRKPVVRYERERPGELVHVDAKKLGRIILPGHRVTGDRSRRAAGKAGWQYLFVAIDDATRLGFAGLYPDETADSAIAFLEQLLRFYGRHGIRVERVLSDNGKCFKRRWADACSDHQIRVKKTRPYRPQTNGKAERFIRTLLERWAYADPSHARAPAGRSHPSSTRLIQSLPATPRPRRTDPASARQQPLWDEQPRSARPGPAPRPARTRAPAPARKPPRAPASVTSPRA